MTHCEDDEIGTFGRMVGALVKKLSVPKVIHHYTSPAGLLGIVRSKAIWATDVRYLSDSQEFRYAVDLAGAVIRDWGADAEGDRERSFYKSVEMSLRRSPSNRLFVTSFSAVGDLLSQWRAYCPVTGGFAIGFTTAALIESTNIFAIPCIDDQGRQKEFIELLLMLVLTKYREVTSIEEPGSDAALDMVSDEFLSGFLLLAAAFKHPGFAEEQEWRMFTLAGPPDVLFREGRSGIVPYIELPLRKVKRGYPLRQVTVGPSPHIDLGKQAVDQFLTANKLKDCGILSSSIPFRAW